MLPRIVPTMPCFKPRKSPWRPLGFLRPEWSHAGLHATFANELTRRRKHFAPALARDLPIVQELRHTADYRNQHLSARQATRALSKARAFVQAITRSLAHG